MVDFLRRSLGQIQGYLDGYLDELTMTPGSIHFCSVSTGYFSKLYLVSFVQNAVNKI